MNENWYWQLAQQHQRELEREASDARMRREAGVPDRVPAIVKALGVLMLAAPVALVAVRVIGKL